MKKTLALLSILIVILFAFSACGDESSSTPSTNGTDDVDNRPPTQEVFIYSFSEYLDYMKYDEAMSQQDFDSFLRQFLYDGETIIKNFYHGDGAGYSEYAGGCSNVYFKLRGEDFDEYTEYTKLFSTKAPLAGLTLPYGVTFDSTVEETLQVLGVSDVGALPTGEETITLVTNDNGTVTISRTENTTGSFYLVEYKESYQVSSNDKTDDVWRYVRFYFEQDSESLAKFELCMVRHHPESK